MKRFLLLSLALSLLVSLPSAIASLQDRAGLEQQIEKLRKKLNKKEKEFLSPSQEDQAAFADFLKQPDTGLIRLLPRGRYEDKLIIRGGGAYYSFTRLTHEYGYGSDIELQQGKFSVGFAGADFGFLCDLGSAPIEQATLDHPAANFPSTFAAPTLEPEARRFQRLSGEGFTEGGFTYISRLDAKEGRTYLLRSISYDRSDVLVAVRAVRQDSDSSIILLWKILKKFPVPKLERS